MAKETINIVCTSCDGTGVYVGFAEIEGAAVVCSSCNGRGWSEFKFERALPERRVRKGVTTVFRRNQGFVLSPESAGGLPYEEWRGGARLSVTPTDFDRKSMCPAWYWQNNKYENKPDWKECSESLGRSFPDCPHFKDRAKCWARSDKELAKK